MSAKTTTAIHCDRCEAVITTHDGAAPEANPDRQPALDVSFTDRRVCFWDLCDKCRGVVGKLVDRISLAKSDKPESDQDEGEE